MNSGDGREGISKHVKDEGSERRERERMDRKGRRIDKLKENEEIRNNILIKRYSKRCNP